MYAPKLRFMTDDERWFEGFCYRIDVQADAALAEIKVMADKAREALPAEKPKSFHGLDWLSNLHLSGLQNVHWQPLRGQQAMSGGELHEMMRRQMEGLRPAQPGLYSGLLGGMGNIFR